MSEQPQQYQDYTPRHETTVFDDSTAEVQLDLHMNTVPKYDADAIAAAREAAERSRVPSLAELQAQRVRDAATELRNLQAARRYAQGIQVSSDKAA